MAQAALATAAIVWVWRSCRRGLDPGTPAVVATATFLASPHAFVYDLPMLGAAVVLWVNARAARGAPFSTAEILVLLLALAFPLALVHGSGVPLLPTASLLLLAACLLARPAVTPGPPAAHA